MPRRRIFLARPRLDCSFKRGPVPAVEGPPTSSLRVRFGRFLDRLEAYHRESGDVLEVETRPLWQFELEAMQKKARQNDRLYFPHKLRSQFPIGDNALYYKKAPLDEYTVDPAGWGASLSFLPPPLVFSAEAEELFVRLRGRIARNESGFDQPAPGSRPVAGPYSLFVCQVPHDETIQFHSTVTVAQALTAVIAYCERRGVTLVVKGHPANPEAMQPLRALTDASRAARWVRDVSIHTCLAGADRVYLVNSGVGFEALLHDKTVIRFGHAEYDCVTPMSAPDVNSLIALEAHRHSREDNAAFLHGYLRHCIQSDDPASYAAALEAF
ncbi:MAG TPA: hypothetical protein VMI56_18970 [Reyranella sp.]|nr:hypothetical protein [Reyranella sp.]